jgi:hypothetical protein
MKEPTKFKAGGAKLDQIQLSLGHASLTTTERYLGVHQDLHDAPCDYIKLDLSAGLCQERVLWSAMLYQR